MIITAIEPFERGKNRVAVYLNDEFAFVLYKGELSKYKLEIGNSVDEDLYNSILTETLYKRARLRGMNLLQKMDRTEYDLRDKLKKGGYPMEVIDNAIEYLKSFKYIDDKRYADNYVHFKQDSMSRREIINKLREKGVSDSVIEESVSCIENDKEIEVICDLIQKRVGNNSSLEYNDKMKLFSYLYRKGYSIDNIERAYNTIEIRLT